MLELFALCFRAAFAPNFDGGNFGGGNFGGDHEDSWMMTWLRDDDLAQG
ncbi:MAG: hypothetical protein AAFR12_14115 [Cyanobacteria bacterium J06626_6]